MLAFAASSGVRRATLPRRLLTLRMAAGAFGMAAGLATPKCTRPPWFAGEEGRGAPPGDPGDRGSAAAAAEPIALEED
jgi:hypothetical protein